MRDGVATGETDPAELEAIAADNRLIRRVRWQLVAWSGFSTLLVLVVLGAALYLIAAQTLADRGNQQLMARADDFREHPDPRGPGYGFRFGGASSGTIALLADANGQSINFGPGPGLPTGFPVEAGIDAARTAAVDVRTTSIGGTPVRVRTERAISPIGTVFIQVIQDRSTEQATLDAMLRLLLVGGAVVVIVAIGFGAVYARRALVPIRESLGAQRDALRRQREFAADASHELRTPLTVVRSSLEFLRRHPTEPVGEVGGALDDIDSEVDRMASLVDDLLLLARSDSGAVPLARQPLDLGDVAAAAASSMAKPAGAKDVKVVVDPEPAMVEGDSVRLRQLVMILVDNAIRHSPTGGEVRVAVRRDGTAALLDVEDQGRGVRPEDMPHLFDRFWRASGAPSGGTGLGLAIAKWIVDRHRGTITVSNRAEGGAQFRVRLPSLERGSASDSASAPVSA
jgi:two-component system, OmpR family, sensor histidine kinase CiaH